MSSAGWDSISVVVHVVVKATYHSFIETLTHILNLSIIYGVFSIGVKICQGNSLVQSE